jgi:antitoxin component YwqK of YwqJK toxin-antitoxin module
MNIKQFYFLVIAFALPVFSFSQGPNYSDLANHSTHYFNADKYAEVSGEMMSYRSNGLIEEKGVLLDGERQGAWFKYTANGTKISEAHYNRGEKTGTWKIWNASGNLQMVMHYRNGNRSGRWKIFDNSGNLIRWRDY